MPALVARFLHVLPGLGPDERGTVEIDPDGKSVWVFERCGKNTCAGSTLAPILKFDASGALIREWRKAWLLMPQGTSTAARTVQ